MSYGKDQSQLSNIPGYGATYSQKAGNATRKRQRKEGDGGNRPYWVDTFKPQEMVPTWCRLIPVECAVTRIDDAGNTYTETVPWFEYREHYHGRYKKSTICSAGPLHFMKTRRDPCVGCDIYWSTPKASKGEKKVISKSEKYVFAVVDMSNFHKVAQVDREGHFRMNQETNQPYLHWVRCTGYGCTNCPTAYETRAGYIQPWAMSKAHFNALNAYAEGIGTCCVSCGGRGTIRAVTYNCAGCGAVVIDTRSTTANPHQIRELVSQHYHCRACGISGYPAEVIQCSGCPSPRRATIFDVDINVMVTRTGEGDQTALILQNTTDPKPLDPQFEDLKQYVPNLPMRFAPTPLPLQAELFQADSGNQAQPQVRAYGNHPAQTVVQPPRPGPFPATYGAPGMQPQQHVQQAAADFQPPPPPYPPHTR